MVDAAKLTKDEHGKMVTRAHLIFRDLPGYPWVDPCPKCGFRGSCDCTVRERALAAYPNMHIPTSSS